MSPDEVLKRLAMMGVKSSRATLLRYKDAGLISKPEEGAGGRGVGRYTDYPSAAVFEYFASYHVIKGKHASFGQAQMARCIVQLFHNYSFQAGMWANSSRVDKWKAFNSFANSIRKKYSAKNGKEPSWLDDSWEEFAEDTNSDVFGFFKEAIRVYRTPFVVDWWELFQIAEGKIDDDYIEFCDQFSWDSQYAGRGKSILINTKIDRLFKLLGEVTRDLAELINMRDDDGGGEYPPSVDYLIPLGRWMALYNSYPDLQLIIRTAMLQNYRSIRPATLDLLTTGKLPEV